MNNYTSGGETGEEEEEEVVSAGKRRDEFPFLSLNLFLLAPHLLALEYRGLARKGVGGALGNVRDDGRRKSRWRFCSSVSMGYV